MWVDDKDNFVNRHHLAFKEIVKSLNLCLCTWVYGSHISTRVKFYTLIPGIQLLPGEVVHAISMETNDIAGINCPGSHRFHADIWN
jgi:hypothetical protein